MRDYAILPALAHEPRSGYDLTKWFEKVAGHRNGALRRQEALCGMVRAGQKQWLLQMGNIVRAVRRASSHTAAIYDSSQMLAV